jgi:hypothetical protein
MKKNTIIAVTLSPIIIFVLINIYVISFSNQYIINDIEDIPKTDAVIILGAQVIGDKLSNILLDRTENAIDLYENNKVDKILISGDHGKKYYDEVNAIKKYLLDKNISSEDIFIDHAGFDTYDSMYRAQYIFEVNSAIISTQKFHLSRAIYIARKLNIDAYGFPADKRPYSNKNEIRELFARIKAWIEINFGSNPKFLGEKIPISGNSQDSWDIKIINNDFKSALLESALKQTTEDITYDPSYFQIDYPNGDIPSNKGVCTDVIIRAYRTVGIDLQEEVHEDMANNFNLYPSKWGLSTTDTNIDHRRVPNLQVFFSRFGEEIEISNNPDNYLPGDIVTWDLGKGVTHIGLVTNHYQNKTPLIVHNIGAGPKLENMLFDFEITGHYRYKI